MSDVTPEPDAAAATGSASPDATGSPSGAAGDTPGAPGPLPTALAERLQRLLATEHATVYGYGVAGARLSGARRRRATADLDAHRARRDRLRALIAETGASPEPAAPAYALPSPVTDAESATALLVRLEESVAAHYADLVAEAEGEMRTFAALSLSDAAVRAARWRGSTVPFPGLPERDTS